MLAIASLVVLLGNSNITTAQAPTVMHPVPQNEFTLISPTPTKHIPKVVDTLAKEPIVESRPGISQVAPKAKTVVKSTPKRFGVLKFSGSSIRGLASYYCCTNGYPSGNYAAAGPQLRVAMGGGYSANASQPWKGKTVTVCGSKGCANVKLVDWCQCYWKQSHEKLIDVYQSVFIKIGASKGTVTVSW